MQIVIEVVVFVAEPAHPRDLILFDRYYWNVRRRVSRVAPKTSTPRLFFSLWVTAMPEGEDSLFDDLDAALQSGSSNKRLAMLRRDLFPSEADRLNEVHLSVFDNVLVQLVERIETRLREISECLA